MLIAECEVNIGMKEDVDANILQNKHQIPKQIQ